MHLVSWGVERNWQWRFLSKYIHDSLFNKIEIKKINITDGILIFISVATNNNNKSTGKTDPMTLEYMNDVQFEHRFEIVGFNDA